MWYTLKLQDVCMGEENEAFFFGRVPHRGAIRRVVCVYRSRNYIAILEQLSSDLKLKWDLRVIVQKFISLSMEFL